jgi:HTH-type transcriptional regulator / antitoxin HipB
LAGHAKFHDRLIFGRFAPESGSFAMEFTRSLNFDSISLQYSDNSAKIAVIVKFSIEQIGQVAKSRRKTLGLTQRQLADLSECSIVTVVALERGKTTLRVDKLLSILSTLGLQIRLEIGKEGFVSSVPEPKK